MATLANLLLLWPNRKKGEKHWENHYWPLNGALLCNDTLTEVSFTFSNIGTLITNNSAVDVLPEFCFWKLANGKLLKGDQSKIHKKHNTFPFLNNQLDLGVLLHMNCTVWKTIGQYIWSSTWSFSSINGLRKSTSVGHTCPWCNEGWIYLLPSPYHWITKVFERLT